MSISRKRKKKLCLAAKDSLMKNCLHISKLADIKSHFVCIFYSDFAVLDEKKSFFTTLRLYSFEWLYFQSCCSAFSMSRQGSPQWISFHRVTHLVWADIFMPDALPDTTMYLYPCWGPAQGNQDLLNELIYISMIQPNQSVWGKLVIQCQKNASRQ